MPRRRGPYIPRTPTYSGMRARKPAPSVPKFRLPPKPRSRLSTPGTGALQPKWTQAPGPTLQTFGAQMAGRGAELMGQLASGFAPWLADIEASKPPGGYGDGGGQMPAAPPEVAPLHKVAWKEGKFDLKNARAPAWWKPLTPTNKADMKRPDVAFLAMLNASIPYLSPEDQMNAAAQLYAIDANHFAAYKPEQLKPHEKKVITQATALLSDEYKRDPSQFTVMTPEMRRYFQSSERAEGFTDMLNQLREQTGIARKMVAGTGMPYTWLQQISGTLMRQGGEAGIGQTRSQYMSMLGALDPLMAMGKAPEIGGALGIGQMFARPFFSPRPLWPRTEVYGKARFGRANPLLYA